MAQGKGQLEIQLGHLCNNRCVFCVSGQLTSRGEAPFLRVSELTRALDEGWAAGHRRVTLLGGEPTIQPYFMEVLRHAVALGFEVVVFSNGSKPGRTDLVDEVAATGGAIEWRFSFQGATREAHERTTRRRGSFAQLVRSVDRARAHGHRVSVNMCVVRQNQGSVDAFPALLLPRGVAQLHLDMVNPYDTGTLDADGITALLPRYSDLVAPMERMIAGFPDGFDVNIGNLPYCVAPHLARWIHHGGERTWTLTANDHGASELGQGRKKYALKQAFKSKPEGCRRCIFDDRCSGAFDAYLERFGASELSPVLPDDPRIDPLGDAFALRVLHVLRGALRKVAPPAPFERVRMTEAGPRELAIAFTSASGAAVEVALVPSPEGDSAFATDLAIGIVRRATAEPEAILAALRWLWDASIAAGARPIHAPGPDVTGAVPRSVAMRLARLRSRAPFGDLRWIRTDAIPSGAEISLASPAGERVVAWIGEAAGKPRAGYRIEALTAGADGQNTSSSSSTPTAALQPAASVPDSHGAPPAPTAALQEGVRRLLVALGRLPEAALAEAR